MTRMAKTKPKSKPAKKAKAKSNAKTAVKPISPAKTLTKGGRTIRIYGHEVEQSKITNAAIEARNKKRYTTHDIPVHEYISDPKFHELMIKIAILDRIEEELVRLYPEREIDRINTVTILVR